MLTKRKSPATLWPFEGFFDDFWTGLPWRGSRETFVPNLDIFEDETGLTIRAELPGLSQREVQVEIEGDLLTIRGEKKEEEEKKEKEYHRIECRHGSFLRQIQLPDSVETEKASATHKDGILTIHFPKRAESKKRSLKIDIQ
jgi:HSP20 family protein